MKSKGVSAISWGLRIVAAGILLQTLYFKFTGAEESVYIFSRLGVEPWGRIGAGIAELIAAILLLAPRTVVLGAGFSLCIIAGAIVSHLAVLGIEVQGDGGLLFGLAITVFMCSAILLIMHRASLRAMVAFVRKHSPLRRK